MSPFPLRSFNTLFKEITDLDALYEEGSKLPEVIILLEYTLQSARQSHIARESENYGEQPKVGEVPTFRASDTDTNLPIVSADLFHGF
jgi:hypothetical protein